MEEYEEVETEEYIENSDVSDFFFVVGLFVIACLALSFIFATIRKTFKNVHLKIGNKVEVGIETKEDKKS